MHFRICLNNNLRKIYNSPIKIAQMSENTHPFKSDFFVCYSKSDKNILNYSLFLSLVQV